VGTGLLRFYGRISLDVSIQLVSPASGDSESKEEIGWAEADRVSIQLVSPASGDWARKAGKAAMEVWFPFN